MDNKQRAPIVIFASGAGSNAKALWQQTQQQECSYSVAAIFCNNKNAGIIDWSLENKIPLVLFENSALNDTAFLHNLKPYAPRLIVLAGFLRKIPSYLVQAYPNAIVNIHPALLPKYGGKGMYGQYVHQAVKEAAETVTGITIHYVNEHYDEGNTILQKSVTLTSHDSAEDIAHKVLQLEHLWYSVAINKVLAI